MKRNDSEKVQIKENLLSTLRAMLADEDVQIDFVDSVRNNFFSWDYKLVENKKSVVVPEIVSDVKTRAAVDLAAAYILFHNFAMHREKEYDEKEQKILDDFERARVICKIKNSYLGAAQNILEKLESDIFSDSNNLSLILLNEVFAKKTLPRTATFAAETAEMLNKKIVDEIKNLAKKLDNQQAFAQGVERVLELLRKEQDEQNKNHNEEKSNEKLGGESEQMQNDLSSFGQENVEAEVEQNFSQDEKEEGEKLVEQEQKISDLKEDDKKGDVTVKVDESGSDNKKIEFKNSYKVYTTKFDEVVFPQKMVNKNELELLRDQLDLKMNKLDSISKKMTMKLKRKLLSKRDNFIEFDASRGILNRKKLTQLVINPMVENIWITNRNHEYQDTALTILLDNSGSMRGNPIVMSAMACEIIAGILEKFAIKTEVIGFTTSDWKGGKARKLWESSGREKNPGRLNELRHIIYKHFNQRFKKARVNLGLMLKEGLLKENIDGEALLFARSRLAQQSEKRKILLVISDGTPVDDSTNSANDSDILTDHLHHVIGKIENAPRGQSQIEIVGIGIGHSTEEFYRNQVTIKSLEELGDMMIEKIVDLL